MGRSPVHVVAADVILPVLNEAEALPWVLERMPEGYRPIVVDNGSIDGSGDIASELGATVVREATPGFGAACFAGLVAAEAEIVCFMDCDASLDPWHLDTVSRPVATGDVDLMLGARIPLPGAWPLHARLGNRAIAWELRRRTRLALSDPGPMRAALRAALLALEIEDRRFGWPFEMILRAHAAGWRVAEVPVPYLPRAGRSKVTGSIGGTARALRDIVQVMR